MKQPALGITATVLVMAFSLAFIALFDFPTFSGWVTYALICLIPMEIVAGITWQANPESVRGKTQPAKGAILVLVCLAAAIIVGPVHWQILGGGIDPPAPMLMMAMIVSVVVMFWMAVMFGGWPFLGMFRNPVMAGVAMLVACYVVNYALFEVLFNYEFMAGAPVYAAELDPQGLYNANDTLVFYVTFIGVLFLLLHFDLWPLTKSPSLMQQPALGIVWTVLGFAIGGAAFYIGVVQMGMDSQLFLIRVPIPFIFGTIVVLNMLQNSVFASLTQPARGIANSVLAMVVGSTLAAAYGALAPMVTGELTIGPPTNDYERWLASALLAVTFPFLIFFAEFFEMWPLKKARNADAAVNAKVKVA